MDKKILLGQKVKALLLVNLKIFIKIFLKVPLKAKNKNLKLVFYSIHNNKT
jgi:hypothetical protein